MILSSSLTEHNCISLLTFCTPFQNGFEADGCNAPPTVFICIRRVQNPIAREQRAATTKQDYFFPFACKSREPTTTTYLGFSSDGYNTASFKFSQRITISSVLCEVSTQVRNRPSIVPIKTAATNCHESHTTATCTPLLRTHHFHLGSVTAFFKQPPHPSSPPHNVKS